MLDIKKLRDNFEEVKSALKKRGFNIDQEKFQSLDKKRKVLQVDVENLQAEKNKLSSEFGKLKSAGESTDSLKETIDKKTLELNEKDSELKIILDKIESFLLRIPNISDDSVPEGKNEEDNVVVSTHGSIDSTNTLDHLEITGLIDVDLAVKLAGARFSVEGDTNQMTVHIIARGNLSPSQKLGIALDVEDIVRTVNGIKTTSTLIGGESAEQMIMSDSESRSDEIAMMMIELKPVRERRHADILRQEILEKTSILPGVIVESYKVERKPESGKDIQIELTSSNNLQLTKVTESISNKLKSMNGIMEVDDTRSLPGIEWIINVDRELAGKYGVDVSIIGSIIQLVTNGILVDKYRPDDSEDEVDIRVRFPRDYRQLEQFDQLRIPTPDGAIPLSNFVKREPQQKVTSIERSNGARILKIRANTMIDPISGKKILPFDKNVEIGNWINEQNFSKDVEIKFAGTNEDGEESAAFLGKAMIGALFLMFIILLTQFNSFYQAAITLSTVVLSTVGALTGLLITGQVFSVIMSGLGIVSLAGIIVNNSIVLIDTFNRLKKDAKSLNEAILHSAAQRLRPIVLTTTTTMIGLTPVALQTTIDWFGRSIEFGGLMSAWWVPFSTAVIWGLGFSSLLTLFLIPALLALPEYLKEKKFNFDKRFLKILESPK